MKFILVVLCLCFFLHPTNSTAQIINPSEVYSYNKLLQDAMELAYEYPEWIKTQSIGTTPFGRDILAIRLGTGETSILLHGAHHGREWMTSILLMKMIETYAEAITNKENVAGFSPHLLEEVSIWFVPMLNPDGVTLQQLGIHSFPEKMHAHLLEMNEGSKDFKRWKANLQGIDLNRQYPANWDQLKRVTLKPCYKLFKGNYPLEAKEVLALFHFTYQVKPEIAVAYHSSGNVLFWGYHQWGLTHTTEYAKDIYKIAQPLSTITNYPLKEPSSHQQGGGYTDWFVQEFKKPGVTIEIGELIEDNSLPLQEFPDIWERNKAVGLFLASKALDQSRD
ncbi:M14 family metallocarboxypeptidase [Mesobacillus maritimus]|uniref:M14 family metallopeptidase n=1 Tax=Mesobacillus maritimus TaxID=1643336 RepID=UPI00203E6C04|nr:M14 family metallocarboxypeptidase [Mesobacillus maritimus]MCM3586634.1 M14 family metallocarboxypeptidase [Mesobacillus maritimus]